MGELWEDLPGVLADRVRLFALELKRATSALGQMMALGLLAAVLAATAWLALWVGAAAALLSIGLGWGWVVLVVLVINMAGGLWCLTRIKALVPLLTLPATLRRLTDSDSEERHALQQEQPAS